MKLNPFVECPVYETENLLFTKIKMEDSEELFEVYSDLVTRGHMNNDNCGGEWPCDTIEIVEQGIRSWEQEYQDKFYIRWTITHKGMNKRIGIIELAPLPNTTRFFDGECRTGILRVDVKSELEIESIFSDIYTMVKDNMIDDFELQNIITKGNPEENQRILGLLDSTYSRLDDSKTKPYKDYYIVNK